MPRLRVIINNLQKLELLEEYKRIQENSDNVSLIELEITHYYLFCL